jgi:hypothetical protein
VQKPGQKAGWPSRNIGQANSGKRGKGIWEGAGGDFFRLPPPLG